MFSPFQNNRKHPSLKGRSLLSLLIGSTGFGLSLVSMPKAVATPPAAGIIIENQATGSFVNPDTNDQVSIESNTVQVTVAEVTGVTLIPAGIQKAPTTITNAGPNQSDPNFQAEDIVYFLFTATNVGNDPTQFFIPGSPLITNGSQSGQIEIIELDPDGPQGSTAPLDFSSLPVTIRREGNFTGDATAFGLPVGAIPAEGTITLRVPVKIDSGLNSGNVSIVLGDTNTNDNSANTQNQDFSDGGNERDFFTEDNQDSDGIAGEGLGNPINGDASLHRAEASASSSLSIGGAPSDAHELSGVVFIDANSNNTKETAESALENVTVYLFEDIDDDGVLTIDDDSDGDGDIDNDDAISSTRTDNNGFYQFFRTNGNYLISVDVDDPDIGGRSYLGTTGTANGPLNLPRNADVDDADILSGLDFPFFGFPIGRDYGDAPDTGTGIGVGNYNTLESDNGPYHLIDPDLFIGVAPDEDDGTLANSDATSDDITGTPNDENGVLLPFLRSNDPGYSINNISVTNNTGSDAYLAAWVDFDRDGSFDSDEGTTVLVPSNGTQNVFLGWNVLPGDTIAGDSFVRLRLTTDTSIADATVNTNSPLGEALDGEVEDYALTINPDSSPPSTADVCETIFVNSSFEVPYTLSTPPFPTNNFQGNRVVAYAEADVPGWDTTDSFNRIELWRAPNSVGFQAFEGEQFAEINAFSNGTLSQDIPTVPGSVLTWQFAHRGREGTDTLNVLIGSSSGTLVAQINDITGTTDFTTDTTAWRLYQGTYTVPAGQTQTRFAFQAVSTANNNISVGNFIDAVRLGQLCDHGDANNNYPVLRGNSGAAHINDGATFLGATVFTEPDGQPSNDASGDDNVSNDLDLIDDEDGVTFTSTSSTGDTTTLDVEASTTGFLNAWVDFNQDGDWDDNGEQIFTDEVLSAGINSLAFAVPEDGSGGSTFARFRFSQDAGLEPTGVASSGEVEDYSLNITATVSNPNVLLVKRITSINGETNNGGVDLASYDPDNTFPYDDNVIEVGLDPADTDRWPNTTDETSSTFLIGARDGGEIQPGDNVEYTIYFLSTGEEEAQNVQFCDRVPDGQSFVPDAFNNDSSVTQSSEGIIGEDQGIVVSYNGNDTSLTNIGGDDIAQFFPPGSGLPPSCNLLLNQSEHNGAIVIDLGNLPSATRSTPTPADSYGFVRFNATVD